MHCDALLWSCSVVSDSLRPHGLQPARLLHPGVFQARILEWAAISFSIIECELVLFCFCSVVKSCLSLCDPVVCSMPGFPVLHHLPEFAQTHVHSVGDAIQPSHLLSPSSPALNLSQHQDLFHWVSSLHHVVKVLEFHLQRQSFQWTSRTDLLFLD